MGLANLRITLKRHSNVAPPKGRAELSKLLILIAIGLDAKRPGDSGAEGSLGRNGQGG